MKKTSALLLLLFLLPLLLTACKEDFQPGTDTSGAQADPLYETLAFRKNDDGKSYSVVGIGDCTEETLVIPSVYKGLPVTKIGYLAFDGCSTVTSVVLPKSISSIGAYAFSHCEALTSLTVDAGNPIYHSAGSCIIETVSRTLVVGCQDSVIPSDGSVTRIADNAFFGCDGLTAVKIPASVTEIGTDAFSDCPELSALTVDEANPVFHSSGDCIVRTADRTLVVGCKNSVIPSDGSVTRIADNAFSYCIGLTELIVPSGVTEIGSNAFMSCPSLASVTLPEGLILLGDRAFSGCTALTAVTLPEGLTQLGTDTFFYCTALTSVTLPSTLVSVGQSAFDSCTALPALTLPASLTSIGDSAFYGCTALTSLRFDGSAAAWSAVSRGAEWCTASALEGVVCTDDTVALP